MMSASRSDHRTSAQDVTSWSGVSHDGPLIAVVIPSYKVRSHILRLIERIGPEVARIFVVDDGCPEGSGDHVLAGCRDPRVVVLHHAENQGVGGAVVTGYEHALAASAEIIIKIDGDGQMDPALIPHFAAPIVEGRADYVKGNRFYNIEDVRTMPAVRLVGNAALSFMTKMSSGYWTLFDPTNGYTAISARVASHLPLAKLRRRYFFESDLLFQLGLFQAMVVDMPMAAVYGDEISSMRIGRILPEFLVGNVVNFTKRVFYNYFLRGFTIASVELMAGTVLLAFGAIFGAVKWVESVESGITASTGTVMLSSLPIILGMQLLLSFLAYDMAGLPRRVVAPLLPRRRPAMTSLGGLRSTQLCVDEGRAQVHPPG